MSDLIDRQAAIDAVQGIGRLATLPDNDDVVRMSAVEYVLFNLPSALQERKKGRWLPDNRNYYEERFVCSVCRKSYEVDTCMGEPTWDFCPGCGADMREEGQNENS